MTNKKEPFLNSNSESYLRQCSQEGQVRRIRPDKFTFLKSNLLVSNIVNRNLSKQKKPIITKETDQQDAYVNCTVEITQLAQEQDVKKAKHERIRNLVRSNSQMTFQEMQAQQKTINDQINNVYLLKKQMSQKAAQILGKKEDNAYLGRNGLSQKQSILKVMKESNPRQKLQKSQTVRLLMKQNAKKCNRQQYRQLIEESMNNISLSVKDLNSSLNANSSLEVSFNDVSNFKSLEKRLQNDQLLRKLRKNQPYEKFIEQQKRKAVWEGFSEQWRKGAQKQQEIKKELRKHGKKPLKSKYKGGDQQILKYNNHCARHEVLKNYSGVFVQTAASYQLKLSNQS